ncbi:hypothetical protein MMC07_008482 [Pseudocyphellaria aurata]|nr:hypothetical protein [Pseudocyphellaria aurata]
MVYELGVKVLDADRVANFFDVKDTAVNLDGKCMKGLDCDDVNELDNDGVVDLDNDVDEGTANAFNELDGVYIEESDDGVEKLVGVSPMVEACANVI